MFSDVIWVSGVGWMRVGEDAIWLSEGKWRSYLGEWGWVEMLFG